MSGETNDNMTGKGKAIDANERQKTKPEGADHIPLQKDEKSEKSDKS